MKISIKNKWTNVVIVEGEVENLRSFLEINRNANLHGADLHGADLHGANLYGADLYGANLHGANLHGADLYGVNLYGANLRGADLYGAIIGIAQRDAVLKALGVKLEEK